VQINRIRARLHHEHIRAPHIFQNLIARLAVRELAMLGFPARYPKVGANRIGQSWIRGSTKDLEFLVGQSSPLDLHTPAHGAAIIFPG
jgi:hypothetical protein